MGNTQEEISRKRLDRWPMGNFFSRLHTRRHLWRVRESQIRETLVCGCLRQQRGSFIRRNPIWHCAMGLIPFRLMDEWELFNRHFNWREIQFFVSFLNSTPRFTTLGHSPSVQFYCCGCVGWFVCSCSCSIIEYSNDFRARNVSVHLTVHTLEQRVGWLDIDTDKLFQSKPGRHFNGKNVTCVKPKRKRKKFQVFIFLAGQVTNDFISVECRNVSISVSLVFVFFWR